ncbi:DUF2817 domain-containing protein [Patescibacteria group bacterium AH-259-L07]|nr:DUF2817 domain-containing protein [Patescibacteria group bacterium AH-259-L07]
MKKYLALAIVVTVLVLMIKPLSFLTKYYLHECPEKSSVKQDDFEMYLEPLDLEKYKQDIFSFDKVFDISVAETLAYREQDFEIYQIDKNGDGQNMLIFAATHGSEFASALVVSDLLNEIAKNPELYEAWNIRILTPINPVGVKHQSRYNEDGCDINRDFQHFLTKGAKLQRQTIDEFNPDVIVSLHEGPQDGFFVIAENSVPPDLQKAIATDLQSVNVALARKSFFGIPLSDSGIWHKKPFVYFVQKLFGIHTLGRYANERGIPMFTTESNWKVRDVNERKKPHLLLIKSVVESYN